MTATRTPAPTPAPPRRRARSRAPGTRSVVAVRLCLVVVLLGLVELAVRAGLIGRLFISPPSEAIGGAVSGLAGGPLVHPMLITLYEVSVALGLSGVAGIAIGYALWRFTTLRVVFEPWVAGLFATPLILLYPIPLVLFGRTTTAVIAQATVMAVLPVILYTVQGFGGVSGGLLKVAAVHRLSPWQRLRHVLAPAAAPTLLTGLRLGMTYILISVVSMEYLAQVDGLGKVVSESYLRFDMPHVYAAVVVVVVITALFVFLTGWGERAVRG